MTSRSHLLALFLVAGCGRGAAGDAPSMPTGCAALADSCLASQQGCVEDAAGARCVTCPNGQYATKTGACEAIGGTPLAHDFAEFTVHAGEEIAGLCQSWTLHNATELWVNGVELTQDEASHHSNWTFVPSTKFPGDDGVWRCSERGYSQLDAALAGGVLYAQSTQAPHEVQRFPNGAAVRIPPWSRIIGDVHLLNASTTDVTGRARLAIYTLAASDVQVKLVPFHMTYDVLAIPPHARSRFTGTCYPGESFAVAKDAPWDLRLYYVLPHTHALGRRFFMRGIGGAMDGRTIFDDDGYDGDAHGRAFDPPLDLRGADGMTFGCEFENPRDVTVGWGIGDQEMCEMLGFADTRMAFEASVNKVVADGTDGDVQKFTGPCNSIMFDWNFDKPGGSPP